MQETKSLQQKYQLNADVLKKKRFLIITRPSVT